jgi:hypothetical protein
VGVSLVPPLDLEAARDHNARSLVGDGDALRELSDTLRSGPTAVLLGRDVSGVGPVDTRFTSVK